MAQMEAPEEGRRLSEASQESAEASEEEQHVSPLPKQHKPKQKRRVSTIASHDYRRSKNRANSKGRLSFTHSTRALAEALKFLENYEASAHEDDYYNSSALKTKHKVGNESINGTLSVDTYDDLDKDDETEDMSGVTVEDLWSWADETEPTNPDLEEKFAQDEELDITGIMNLSSMNLTDTDMPMIIQRAFREDSKKCTGLILRDNAITGAGIKMLVDELLTTRTKLKYFSLSNNPAIKDDGIEHLSRLLRKQRCLTFLALVDTGITDRGVEILADLLCGADGNGLCSNLHKLYISSNKSITDASCDALTRIIEQNQSLRLLSLQHCNLSDNVRHKLEQVVVKKKKKLVLLQ